MWTPHPWQRPPSPATQQLHREGLLTTTGWRAFWTAGVDLGLGSLFKKASSTSHPVEGPMCGQPGPFLGLGQAQPWQDHEPPSHGTQARPCHLAPYLIPCQLANPDAEFGAGKPKEGREIGT